jgi:hypothetical protein
LLDERDIWLTATAMMKRFGDDAIVESAMRADELSAEGDLDGARVWKRVIACVQLLMTTTPVGQVH